MTFGTFNADQFRQQLMNYTEAELIKLGRSCSSAASRWLDPMTNSSMRRNMNWRNKNGGGDIQKRTNKNNRHFDSPANDENVTQPRADVTAEINRQPASVESN